MAISMEEFEKRIEDSTLILNDIDYSDYSDMLLLYLNENNINFITTIEKIFKEDKYCMINNDSISTLFQAVQKNNLFADSKLFKKIKEFSENAENPDMMRYEEEMENLSEMDTEKFSNFMNDVKNLKLKNGVIDEKYCDYIIKQKILSNHFSEKNGKQYYNIFKRAIEDKARWILKKDDIEDCYVYVNPKISLKGNDCGGFVHGKCICLREQEIERLGIDNILAVNTMFHECRHVVQDKHMGEENIDYNEYLMLQEIIISKEDEEFYERNYKYMYNEIDARIAGAKGTYRYLSDLGFSNREILSADNKTLKECYEENLKEEYKNYSDAGKKLNNNNEIRYAKAIFCEILEKNKTLLDKHPILSLEFDENGKVKGRYNILKEYKEEIDANGENSKKAKLIADIFKYGKGMYNRLIQEDLESYIEDSNMDERLISLRNYNIKNIMNKYINEKEGIGFYQDEAKEDKRANFYKIVKKLNQFANLYPNEEISKEIMEKIEPYKGKMLEGNEESIVQDDDEEDIKNLAKLNSERNNVSDGERNEDRSISDCINVGTAKKGGITRKSVSIGLKKIKEAISKFRSSKAKTTINKEANIEDDERA